MQGSKDLRGQWRTSDGDGEGEAEQDVRPMHAAAGRSLLRALALLLLHARHLQRTKTQFSNSRRKSTSAFSFWQASQTDWGHSYRPWVGRSVVRWIKPSGFSSSTCQSQYFY